LTEINRTEIGLEIPNWMDSKGNGWSIEISTSSIHGRNEPVRLTIKPLDRNTRLLQSTLREIPFSKFLQDWDKYPVNPSQRSHGITGAMTSSVLETKSKRGSRRLSTDELQTVADIYLDAFEKHLPVQQAVAKALNIPLSTACKRIVAARTKGFIKVGIERKDSIWDGPAMSVEIPDIIPERPPSPIRVPQPRRPITTPSRPILPRPLRQPSETRHK
jgi:hypothetical protein